MVNELEQRFRALKDALRAVPAAVRLHVATNNPELAGELFPVSENHGVRTDPHLSRAADILGVPSDEVSDALEDAAARVAAVDPDLARELFPGLILSVS